MTAAAHNNSVIPPSLRRKVSPGLVMFVDEQRAVKSVGMLFAVFGLYGPVVGHTEHNAFLYLLGPWVCPSLFTLFWSSVPHRPYRGQFYSGFGDVDSADAAVMRLVELYKSDEARRQMWRESLHLSLVLFAILGPAAYFLRDSLIWVLPSPGNRFLWARGHWFWVGFTLCFIGSFLKVAGGFTRWCLTTWALREAGHT